MDGTVEVFFTVLCDNDFSKEIILDDLLKSEKVLKAIKSEYAQGSRNLLLSTLNPDTIVSLSSEKKVYSHVINKSDIQDILELTEEYAKSQKLFKVSCSRVALKDFKTFDS